MAARALLLPTVGNLNRTLRAFDLQGRNLRILLGSTAVQTGLCIALIPMLGAPGAALATLSADVLLLALLAREVRGSVAPFRPLRGQARVRVEVSFLWAVRR
jgi:O-antigen/teichoic acid export membrane protein